MLTGVFCIDVDKQLLPIFQNTNWIPGTTGDASDGARMQLQQRQMLQAAESQESRRGPVQYRRQKRFHPGNDPDPWLNL